MSVNVSQCKLMSVNIKVNSEPLFSKEIVPYGMALCFWTLEIVAAVIQWLD